MRTRFLVPNAFSYGPPRDLRWSRKPATVPTPAGSSISSAEVPSCSRSAAKKRSFTFTRISPEELRIREETQHLALADRVPGGIVDQAVGPRGRGKNGGILRRIQVQPASRIPFYAQELAPRVGLGPVEIRSCLDGSRFCGGKSLRAQKEWAHEDQKGHEARHRVARQADEGGGSDLAERERPARLHGDAPHEEPPFGLDRRLHVVGLPDRHAPRGHDHIAFLRRAPQHGARRLEAVRDDAVVVHLAVESLCKAAQGKAVGVVDASWR